VGGGVGAFVERAEQGGDLQGASAVGGRAAGALFGAVAKPLAVESTRGAFWRGLRLRSLDGTCLDLADTARNAAAFGRPGSSRREGGGAFPQLRLVGLAECATHAVTAAAMGGYETSENALADELLGSLEVGELCLADRGFYGFKRFTAAHKTGAQLLWRVQSNILLPREHSLPDGSFLTRIYPSQADQRARCNGVKVRVVEYGLEDPGRPQSQERYRLLCTLLDCETAPAGELASLYSERWEIEGTLDELETHQRGPRVVLRSKHPDGVYQELYGYLCTHYAIRRLMHDAALQADLDPDRLSFTRSPRAARRSTRSHPGSPPQTLAA
jgi:hypothetical protein